MAQLAATLGREFSYELLAAVASMDGPTLQAELAKLVQAEILYPKGRPPHCTYIFKHALLEDALYNALVRNKRQQFHRRIAEALESRFPQTASAQPELLAHHFTEAGLAEAAIGYWLKAGLRSRERSAEKEAIGHLTRGLALLQALDESPERDARELELLMPLGTASIASRGYAAPEIGPVFRRARELCERIGRSPQLVAILVGIWEWHFVRGEIRLCSELVAEAMEFAGPLNDPGGMMEASYIACQTMLYRADFAGARDGFASALARHDDPARLNLWIARTGHDAGINIRCNLAIALWHLGFPDAGAAGQRRGASIGPRDRATLSAWPTVCTTQLGSSSFAAWGSRFRRPPRNRSRSPQSKGSRCGMQRERSSWVLGICFKVGSMSHCHCF